MRGRLALLSGGTVIVLLGAALSAVASESVAASSGSTLLVGRVTSVGDPAAGAVVSASVFPAFPGKGFKPGTVVHPLELPDVVTDDQGSYTVALPEGQDLGGYVDRWGRMDVTVVISDGTNISWYRETTRVPTGALAGTGPRSRFAKSAPEHAPSLAMDLGTGGVVETLGTDNVSKSPLAHVVAVDSERAVSARQSAAARHPCRTTLGAKHYGKPERFMYVNNWAGAKATVTQGSGTTHTLGIAMKLAGEGWSADGGYTKSISTSNHATQKNVVDRWVKNKVNYQDVKIEGLCEYPGQRTESRPYSMHTLISGLTNTPFLPELRNPAECQRRGKNYGYTKNETSNLTVSRGVDLGTVKVQAHSGWSRETSFTIDVDRPTKECWSNVDGPEHSRYVHYRAAKRTEPCGRHTATSRCRPTAP
jgi:hypothetical protein